MDAAAVIRKFETARRQVITAAIPGRQLALIVYHGWDRLSSIVHRGYNAEADESTVLYTHRKRTAKNPPMELMIVALLRKTDDAAWTETELSPIRALRISEVTASYAPLGATITLNTGEEYEIDFAEIDGYRAC